MWGLGLENSRWHQILLLLLWCLGSKQGGWGEVFRVLDEREGSRIKVNWGRGQRSLPDESQCAVSVRCVLTHARRKMGDLAATIVGTHPPSTQLSVSHACVRTPDERHRWTEKCTHTQTTSPYPSTIHSPARAYTCTHTRLTRNKQPPPPLPIPIFSDDDSDTASLSRLRDAHLLTSPRGETPQIPFPIKKK